jgi:tetraacyldisaccharide 4'-kinase
MSPRLKTAVRSWIHQRVRRAWRHRGPLALLLFPLHLVHRAWRGLRALAQRLGRNKPQWLPVPVIVVGNLVVGGTGKTPLVIELVAALRARGWSPGVVARGYGAHAAPHAMLVENDSDPAVCGDEPLLVRFVTGAPVAVGPDRVAAARLLLARHAACNLIIADDGLQHRRLGRDLELAVINSAGLGNGWLLPAGPLRDPPERLQSVDAVVLHGRVPTVRIHSPFYRMFTNIEELTSLSPPVRSQPIAELVREQQERHLRLLAICAIGTPERFFGQLHEAGLRFDAQALPDHDPIDPALIPADRYDRILMTEKDAVKCHRDGRLGRDPRIWVVRLKCLLDPGLIDFLASRLGALPLGAMPFGAKPHGPKTA